MAHIVEISPFFTDSAGSEYEYISGVWNSREQAEQLALTHGHSYFRPADGPVTRGELDAGVRSADALILAPTPYTPKNEVTFLPEGHGEPRARRFGHRVLDRISDERPDLPVVVVTYFVVGHGRTHRNGKGNVWAFRALEQHVRRGRNPWTILRPTWPSDIHDEAYQVRLTEDPLTDGLVSMESVAAAVIAAIENPEVAQGKTASIFNLSIPGGATDLRAQYAAISRDFEADMVTASR
jgi:hypothetical protein